MNRLYVLVLLVALFVSCSDDEPLSPQEILISNDWVSEKFIYQGMEYDSLIIYGLVTDTIYSYLNDIYPGDILRADTWMELSFNESLYFNYLLNNSYHKCVNCSNFIHIYKNTFPFSGRYYLADSILETEKYINGVWNADTTYVIEFINNNRIKIFNWLSFPVAANDPELTITDINDMKVEPGDYPFDVIFRKKE
jgi:hypothetical protein